MFDDKDIYEYNNIVVYHREVCNEIMLIWDVTNNVFLYIDYGYII